MHFDPNLLTYDHFPYSKSDDTLRSPKMESMTAAIYWAIAATIVPYLITKPSHIRALLAFFWIYCFGQSVVNYSGATDIDIPSSAVFALLFFLFFAIVTHSPLTWLSIILYDDPYKFPVSQRPRLFSQWFRRPRQLIPPPYSGSQAPDAATSPERMSQQIKDLTEALKDAKSLVLTYMRYVPMYETSQSRIHELEAEVETLKGDAKAHKEEKVYFKAERAIFEKERAKDKAHVDKCETTIQKLMEKRDERIQTRVCRWCKSKVNSLTHVVEDMTKKNDNTTETSNDPVAEAIAAKDKIIAEKDIMIAVKDKIISAKGRDALLQIVSAEQGESKQASLYAHIGELDEQLRVTNCEVARLNRLIDERRYCCCGCCGGALPPWAQIVAGSFELLDVPAAAVTQESGGLNDDGDDGTTTNGGPPRGGNAQPPTSANEPSGAPSCPVAEPSNPPPTTGTLLNDGHGAGASLPPAPTTPSPIPISAIEIPLPPYPAPSTGPTVPDPAALVPLPASPPASVHASPIPVAAALVPVPTSIVGEPSNPPPTAGAPSGDDDGTAGASIPPEPETAMSSPLSSSPPSPIPISAIPTLFPSISAPLTAPVVPEPPMVPLPASPTISTANPVPVSEPPVPAPSNPAPVPEPPAPAPARTLFAPATAGFGPSSTSIFVPVPPATGTSGPPPQTNGT